MEHLVDRPVAPTSQPTPPALQPAHTPQPLAHSQAAPVVSPRPPPPCQGSPPLAPPLATDAALGRFLRERGFDTVTSMVAGWTALLWAASLSNRDPQMLTIVQELVDHDLTPLQVNMPVAVARRSGGLHCTWPSTGWCQLRLAASVWTWSDCS